MTDRALAWDGCLNVRDLGGLPTADGRTTRFGVVVRADNVRGLTEDGWAALAAHGVERIVDLRFDEELAEDPPRELDLDVVHVALLGRPDEHDDDWARTAEFERTADYFAWSYCIALDRYAANFARAVRAIASAPTGAVCVHCQGGRDRTGLVGALVLRVAGVETDVVAEDYALSGEALASAQAEWVAEAPDEEERRRRSLFGETPASIMATVLDALEEHHGSVEEYLRSAGVPDEDLHRLRERLVA